MKKIVAVALALALLLASVAACAESTAGALSLRRMTVSSFSNGDTRSVKLNKMTMSMLLGSVEGIPTLQVTFDDGKGQQVDGVLQIVDTRLLVSLGGVSGTYYIDLSAIASEPGQGEMVAKAIGSALTLAGPHLDLLLYALTTENAKGVRTLEIPLPDDMYVAVADSVLSIVEGLEAAEEIAGDEPEQQTEALKGGTVLRLRYKPDTGRIRIAAMQGDRGVQLSARMKLSVVEDAVFINISEDEMQYDLMNLDEAQMEELRGELDIIALKFDKFALGSGISKLFR